MSVTEAEPQSAPQSAVQTRGAGAQILAAVRMLLVLTLILGVAYPLVMTALARLPWWSESADGSLVRQNGQVVGSSLLGQSFLDASGSPLPQWFQPRPSAAGDGWDGASSGASNLGPSNPDLLTRVAQARADVAAFNGVEPGQVPDDAVTTSGSGLDPDISPVYARIQVARVAQARSLDPVAVQRLVHEHTEGRALGFISEPRVDVLLLNRDLASLR